MPALQRFFDALTESDQGHSEDAPRNATVTRSKSIQAAERHLGLHRKLYPESASRLKANTK
jgi:hypothetical protein